MAWNFIAPILGAALASRGARQSGTTTTTNAPWDAQAPYLTSLFGRAESLYNRGVSPEAYGAQNMAYQQAVAGMYDGGLPRVASEELSKTIGGGYLGANPYLDAMFGSAANRVGEEYQRIVAPTIGGQFARAGRFGSPAYQGMMERSQNVLGQNLTDMAARIYGGAYESERGRMTSAISMAPSVFEASFAPADRAIMYSDPSMLDWRNLQRYQSAVGGAGYGSTSSTPYYTNPYASAAGGALQGAALYRMLSGGGGSIYDAGNAGMFAGAAGGF